MRSRGVIALTTVGHGHLKLIPAVVGIGREVQRAVPEGERGAPDISLAAQIQTTLVRAQPRQR